MKVRVIKEYFDKEMKKTIKPDTDDSEFEVNEARGNVLLAAGVVEDITEEQTEADQENTESDSEQVEDSQENTEADEEKPKKPSKKKEPKNEQ